MKRRLRLLARRKKKGTHCLSWENMLELQSVMRRCIIQLQLVRSLWLAALPD